MVKQKKEVIERAWEYSPEPRLEGLLQASKYLKWRNVESFNKVVEEKNKNN